MDLNMNYNKIIKFFINLIKKMRPKTINIF